MGTNIEENNKEVKNLKDQLERKDRELQDLNKKMKEIANKLGAF